MKTIKTAIVLLVLLANLPALADYENYDEIVDKLSKYSDGDLRENQAYRTEVRTFSRAHLGLGLVQTIYDADSENLSRSMQNQGGLIVNVGVDVFNQYWGLEGSYANYGNNRTQNATLKLREFAVKGLYKPTLNKTWSMRLGLGFSSRFLDVNSLNGGQSAKTPSSLFLVGVESYISSMVSLGADFSLKTAMISDTIDKNSADFIFRIDTHF